MNSELNAQEGPTLQPPAPNVEHSVDTFNPYFTWLIIEDAIEFKFEREKCCIETKNFTISADNLDIIYDENNDPERHAFKDGEIIHSHLEAVATAVPDEWLRYRIKAIFDNEESAWTSWMYYHLPPENNM